MPNEALIVVDMQVDFLPGGRLAVRLAGRRGRFAAGRFRHNHRPRAGAGRNPSACCPR